MIRRDLTIQNWPSYELIDSGEHMKLERFGDVILARPETQAIWKKQNPGAWQTAHAVFESNDGKGLWKNTAAPQEWEVRYQEVAAIARLTNFKHIGIFPEQAPNWDWIKEVVSKKNAPRVLNLFGYTGIASIAAAHSGAHVTHVDASRQSLDWAKDNMLASGLREDAIRWILDDALQFVKREAKRGNVYDGIILDPPAFGRGAKGEVWHIEDDLPKLMHELTKLCAPQGFLLLNGYAAGYTPQSFLQLVQSYFPQAMSEYGELQLPEKTGRLISSGIYVRCAAV